LSFISVAIHNDCPADIVLPMIIWMGHFL